MIERNAPITAVTYDYWNTIIAETTASLTRRKALWTEVLLDGGHEATEDDLNAAFEKGWSFFDRRWRENTQTRLEDVVSVAIAELPCEVPLSLHPLLIEAYLEASIDTPRKLLDEIEESFRYLKEKKTLIGVICDVGTIPSYILEQWLVDLGVHEFIDFFGFSDQIDVYKPHPRIFEQTLKGLGVQDPKSAVHIGDLKRTDVAGARSIGMTTVRYTGGRVDEESGDDADYVSDSHLDIIKFLGFQ